MLFRILFFVGISIELFYSMALAMEESQQFTAEELSSRLEALFDKVDVNAAIFGKSEGECYWRVTEEFATELYLRQQGISSVDIIKFSLCEAFSPPGYPTDVHFSVIKAGAPRPMPSVFLTCPGLPDDMMPLIEMLDNGLLVNDLIREWRIGYDPLTGQLRFQMSKSRPRVILDSVKVLNSLMENQPAFFERGVWMAEIKRDIEGHVEFEGIEGPVKDPVKLYVPMVHQNSVSSIPCPKCGQLEGAFATVYSAASILFGKAAFDYRPKQMNFLSRIRKRGRKMLDELTKPGKLKNLSERKQQALRDWLKLNPEMLITSSVNKLRLDSDLLPTTTVSWIFQNKKSGIITVFDGLVPATVEFTLSKPVPDVFLKWKRFNFEIEMHPSVWGGREGTLHELRFGDLLHAKVSSPVAHFPRKRTTVEEEYVAFSQHTKLKQPRNMPVRSFGQNESRLGGKSPGLARSILGYIAAG